MSWEDEALQGFLKIKEGEHTLTILAEPAATESKFVGKDGKAKIQQVFEGELDGVRGKVTMPRQLLKIFASMKKAGKSYPMTVKFRRTGMQMDTRFDLVV